MFADLSQQTLDLLNKIDVTALNKTTLSQATGLNAFDLRGPALKDAGPGHQVACLLNDGTGRPE